VEHRDHEGEVPRETYGSSSDYEALSAVVGVSLGAHQIETLRRYATWLVTEARKAGGIGPSEAGRLFDRHLADSLMYVRGLRHDMGTILDVGSGVGLPGIPIAIVLPDVDVTLLDRADRRTWLARRAVRILGLTNVVIQTGDVRDHPYTYDACVFRASLPVPAAAGVFRSVVCDGGVGLIGVSRNRTRPDIPEPPSGVGFDLTSEGPAVLDSPFWLLRMRHI
jgi:16S rRNA G527 N7-methylase RsmG